MGATFRGTDVTREQVLDVLNELESRADPINPSWASDSRYKYALVHKGRAYPPKRVLSLVTSIPTRDFTGGPETNRVFEMLGFQIEDRSQQTPTSREAPSPGRPPSLEHLPPENAPPAPPGDGIVRQIAEYRSTFRSGSFNLGPGDSVKAAAGTYKVPNLPGVYLISAIAGGRSELIYIGRSGTVGNDGTFGVQGIRKRLGMKQHGEWRVELFKNLMRNEALDALHFEWFVTFDHENKILPSFAEAQLLQAYFLEHERLPQLNRSA